MTDDHGKLPIGNESRKRWLPFAILAAALIVWAGMFALGAYLEPSADKPVHDVRKPLIVMGTMAAFLAFWGVALWWRNRRK
jgi:membrane protein DedA with SNARE-associated domain